MGMFDRFAEYYDLTYRNMLDYEKDCNILEKIFRKFLKRKPESILDIGCGTGSHALILAKRGYRLDGIDISETMIRKARAKERGLRLNVKFHVQDMQEMRLKRQFDCAISMFGALGYVHTYNGLVNVLSGLRQHLNDDGLFVFEFWNVGGARPSPYQRWIEAKDEKTTLYRLSESNLDPLTNVITVDMKFLTIKRDRHVETFKETHKMRCYTPAEMQQYLEGNGFKLLSVYDWDAEDKEQLKVPRKETFRLLAVAGKFHPKP